MAKHVDVGLWIMRKNGTFEEERTYHARKPLNKD
ncbi:hypothetical protein SERIO_v1c01660 [Spiroplasma eriocheiris]|uniref:Uncharacterized protein n=2 Tax=Spiroplasma TaxID=2132 RepID=A0A0H3XK78_9MOLU|nr:hypothetical protein SERIO_v1c01660 [Spiroplasma eriocheiris]